MITQRQRLGFTIFGVIAVVIVASNILAVVKDVLPNYMTIFFVVVAVSVPAIWLLLGHFVKH